MPLSNEEITLINNPENTTVFLVPQDGEASRMWNEKEIQDLVTLLNQHPHITELYIDDSELGMLFSKFAECKYLQQLSARNAKLTDKALESFAGNKTLNTLNICGNPEITSAGIKNLQKTNLTGFYLANTAVDNTVKEILVNMNLTDLDLSSTQITDVTVKDIASKLPLQRLYLNEVKVTHECIEVLTSSKTLEELSCNSLLADTVVVNAFMKNQVIQQLELKIEDFDLLENLTRHLQENKLRKLDEQQTKFSTHPLNITCSR